MSIIGQQIKKYRMENGLTQEQVGRMIGVTTQAVSKWERGSTPDAEILPLIADALGVSVDALRARGMQLGGSACKKAVQNAAGGCVSLRLRHLLGDRDRAVGRSVGN